MESYQWQNPNGTVIYTQNNSFNPIFKFKIPNEAHNGNSSTKIPFAFAIWCRDTDIFFT